jgi:hypothetical protein
MSIYTRKNCKSYLLHSSLVVNYIIQLAATILTNRKNATSYVHRLVCCFVGTCCDLGYAQEKRAHTEEEVSTIPCHNSRVCRRSLSIAPTKINIFVRAKN